MACPTPHYREIGFVSSSFSFRSCCACRACGRGEAVRVRERHDSSSVSSVRVCAYFLLLGVCCFFAGWASVLNHFACFCAQVNTLVNTLTNALMNTVV